MAKILLINNGYPTKNHPQRCTYIKTIKEDLEVAGHQVSLCVMDSDYNSNVDKLISYFKFYFILNKTTLKGFDFIYLHHYFWYSLAFGSSLVKAKQVVLHWHGSDLTTKNKIATIYFNLATKLLPKKVMHLVPSKYFQNALSAKYKLPLAAIEISPSGGIDTTAFLPIKKEKKGGNKIILGFASGLIEEKGVNLIVSLLNATRIIQERTNKEVILHYIFYGKSKDKYHRILTEFPNTKCFSVMPKSEMSKFYQKIDILLFPTRGESLGLVALEAMSCGCPVVGTDDFALKEYIISGKSGERFRPYDSIDFIQKTINAIEHIENYNPRPTIEEYYSKESVIRFYKAYFR